MTSLGTRLQFSKHMLVLLVACYSFYADPLLPLWALREKAGWPARQHVLASRVLTAFSTLHRFRESCTSELQRHNLHCALSPSLKIHSPFMITSKANHHEDSTSIWGVPLLLWCLCSNFKNTSKLSVFVCMHFCVCVCLCARSPCWKHCVHSGLKERSPPNNFLRCPFYNQHRLITSNASKAREARGIRKQMKDMCLGLYLG